MSYRCVFISDIHWNNRLPHAKPTTHGRTDRLEDQIALWERVKQTTVEFKARAVFVLGDVFDKALVDAVTLTAAVEAIASTPVPVFILAGNHDAINTRGGRFIVEAFGAMGNENVRYMETGRPITPVEWLTFHPVEFCPSEQAKLRIKEARVCRAPGTNVLLLHQSIMGCEHAGWTCDDGLTPEDACDGFNYTFSGHFHPPQHFGRDNRGMYLGAPMHHRFDDMGREAGYWAVEFSEKGGCLPTFVEGGAPKMFDFMWPDNLKRIKEADPGDYVRITCEATHTEWRILQPKVEAEAERLRTIGFRVPRPRFKPLYHHAERVAKTKGSTSSLEPEVLWRQYVKSALVDKSGLDPKRLLKLGLEALAHGRTESGK